MLFQVIVHYIVDNGLCGATGGVAMWQQMEEQQVVRGARWQWMKERFRRSILGRLDSFDLTAEARQQLLKGEHPSATSSSPSRNSTTVFSPTLSSTAVASNTSSTSVTVDTTTVERTEGETSSAGSQSPKASTEPEVIVTVASSSSICPICLERVDSRIMSRHKLKHENLLPPPCNLCGKQLGRKDSLARHLRERCTR